MVTLDSLDLQDVDYMKLDVEGWEANVIVGAEQTIKAFRPVIMVEQKRDFSARFGIPQKEAVKILLGWGYKEVREVSGDHILVHP